MEKAGEPVDYLSAMERMRREEQNKKSQIRSPDFFPQEGAAVDYRTVSRAWDKAQKGRNVINMPAEKTGMKDADI